MSGLDALRFDNRFVRELPGDPEQGHRRREVRGALWSPTAPTPVAAPTLLAHSREVAALLGLDDADVASPTFAQVFGGNALLQGMQPYAGNYGGHQFGNWAGQLGDGRAITLGEAVNGRGGQRDRVFLWVLGQIFGVQRGDAPSGRSDHAGLEPGRHG